MNERDLFTAALGKTDPAARSAYLDEACGEDRALRARVEVLLRAHERPDSLLDHPAVPPHDPTSATTRTIGHEGGAAADDEVPLGFLGPATRPDSLGRMGHYEVLQVLGKGGFGIVFRAFDGVLQRVVAVKVLAPALAATSPARKRFLREARSSAAVRHENVVQVYAVEEQPLPYLVMEFIPGETLQERLKRTGPIEVPEVVRFGRQVAEGLAAAHERGLIHRDVKPGNVLIEAGSPGRAKLTDFGLARAADDASISQSGIVAGTPMYMSPEQARGAPLDHRSDLFGLGSVLYVMCSGRPPFRAENTLAVLKRVVEDAPRPIREIIPETPEWLCRIIERLHAKDPADRFQTAREVADLLAECEGRLRANGDLAALVPAPARRSGPRPGRKWAAAAAAGVAVALLVGAAVAVSRAVWPTDRPVAQNVPAPPPQAAATPAPQPDPDPPRKSRQDQVAEAFAKYVAALPPEDQVAAVEAELKKRNPEFGGKVFPGIEKGQVTKLNLLDTQNLTDLTPVAALVHLRELSLPPAVTDIAPLKNLRLRTLRCFGGTGFTDLTPLAGMSLEALLLWGWTGDNASPLRGMPLRELNLGGGGGKVDLTVLRGMPLESLYLMQTDVKDLTPLAGMRLKDLGLSDTNVSDLSVLRGMPLVTLSCGNTAVSDLTPLEGMPLTALYCQGARVTDLRPIAGAPLKALKCDFVPERDAAILRGVKTLETINDQPAADVLKQAEK